MGRVQHYDESYSSIGSFESASPPPRRGQRREKSPPPRKAAKPRKAKSSEVSDSPLAKARHSRKSKKKAEKEAASPPKKRQRASAEAQPAAEKFSEAISTVPAGSSGPSAAGGAVNVAAISSSIAADVAAMNAGIAAPAASHPGGFAAGAQMAAQAAQADALATQTMDFSRMKKNSADLAIDMPKVLVSILFTPAHSKLLCEESGATVEWDPEKAKVLLSGSAEQLGRAQRLLNRIMIQSQWGLHADKVRQCLKPRRLKSVLCRLSPMEPSLPAADKTLNALHPRINLGKGPENHLILPNPHRVVSRQHCIIEYDETRGGVYVHDCSANGTWLNSRPLPTQAVGKVMLSHGDELLFRDPKEAKHEFGYMVNLEAIVVEAEQKLEQPRRLHNADELNFHTRERF